MRIPSLVFKSLGLVSIYVFASGALAIAPRGGSAAGQDFLARLIEPFLTATPLEASVLVAGLFSLAAGAAFAPRHEACGAFAAAAAWPRLLLAACLVNGAVVLGIAFRVIVGPGGPAGGTPQVAALFAAGVLEAALGIVLAFGLFIIGRSRKALVSSLGILLAGIAALGSVYWLGNG